MGEFERVSELWESNMTRWWLATIMLLLLATLAVQASGVGQPSRMITSRMITIDGNFADWADLPPNQDAANDEHDTDHKGQLDSPDHVEHADVDILETKFTHDAENLYAYFKARGTIG